MQTKLIGFTLALVGLTATAVFAATNPHMGTWKLNEAKSTLMPDTGKNTTVTYSQEKDKIKVTVDGVDKDGKPRHAVWIGKFDGKVYPSKGNMPWDAASYTAVNEWTNEITTMKDGKVLWSGPITVSKDGKSRTVTINGTDANGKKYKSKAVYDKE